MQADNDVKASNVEAMSIGFIMLKGNTDFD